MSTVDAESVADSEEYTPRLLAIAVNTSNASKEPATIKNRRGKSFPFPTINASVDLESPAGVVFNKWVFTVDVDMISYFLNEHSIDYIAEIQERKKKLDVRRRESIDNIYIYIYMYDNDNDGGVMIS